jgi:hypothetical protein
MLVFNIGLSTVKGQYWMTPVLCLLFGLHAIINFRSVYCILYRMRWLGFQKLYLVIDKETGMEFTNFVFDNRDEIGTSNWPYLADIRLERRIKKEFGLGHIEIGTESTRRLALTMWFRSDADAVSFRIRNEEQPAEFYEVTR